LYGGSAYFDGTGDYLTINHPTNFFLTGAFTIEAWIYVSGSLPSTAQIFGSNNNGATQWSVSIGSNSNWGLWFYYGSYGANQSEKFTGIIPPTNTWTHIAISRDASNNWYFFQDGIKRNVSTFGQGISWSDSISFNTANTVYVGGNSAGGAQFTGYISDLRVTKGAAVYTSSFIPPTRTLSNYSTSNPSVLLLNMNNGGIVDNHSSVVLETVGNTQLAPQDPYAGSYYSNYFNGTGDYLTLPASAGFGFGTGDFTVEMWIYPTSNKVTQFLFDTRDSGASTGTRYVLALNNTTSMYPIVSVGNTTILTSSQVVSIGSWYHIAVSKASGTVKLFINGVQVGSATSNIDVGASSGPAIGTTGDARGTYDGYFAGYISNVRVVKNQALYTGTFTPSTTPLTAITNTTLLTCQSNRVIDNSSNALTITRAGSPVVKLNNPFQSNSGKSVYFDGTGDWLYIPYNPIYNLNTATPFTIEMWAYFNVINTGDNGLLAKRGAGNEWQLNMNAATGYLNFWNGTSTFQSNIPVAANQWYHLATTWDATTLRFFVNGVMSGNTHTTLTITPSTNPLYVGYLGPTGAAPMNGYLKDLRFTKGVARYTENGQIDLTQTLSIK
jgi:hypothetical protein